MFSKRTRWSTEATPLDVALRELRASGADLCDLTESNVTAVGLATPRELPGLLGDRALPIDRYTPESLGLGSARRAIAAHLHPALEADRVVISASTSEAYAWLFKLLADPGDTVLVPSPSYPLFEYLAELEGVSTQTYRLIPEEGFRIDLADIEATLEQNPRVRAIVVVSPNNPTGTLLRRDDATGLDALASSRGVAILADEVFVPFLHRPCPDAKLPTFLDTSPSALTFVLDGASKSLASPQLKIGWTSVHGPSELVRDALARLEIIADTYLSVSTPVQLALPRMLGEAPKVAAEIGARIRSNLSALDAILTRTADCPIRRLDADGGFTILLELPRFASDEALVLGLARHGVIVMPGYFFDVPMDGVVVLSLIVPERIFAEGVERIVRHFA